MTKHMIDEDGQPSMQWHRISFHNIGNGIMQVEAWSTIFPAPVGIMWLQRLEGDGGIVASILHAYTLPWSRRRGVASDILDWIRGQCHTVSTMHGSGDGGAEFLKANGFKFCDASGTWNLAGKLKPNPKPKAKTSRRRRPSRER